MSTSHALLLSARLAAADAALLTTSDTICAARLRFLDVGRALRGMRT